VSVYSVRFGVAEPPAATNFTLFTVPSGSAWVLRDIQITNGDSSAHQLWVQVASSAGSLLAYIYRNPTHPATQAIGWNGRVVLEVGELIQCGSTGPSSQFIASGYQLAL
jgi:hypothetical protein